MTDVPSGAREGATSPSPTSVHPLRRVSSEVVAGFRSEDVHGDAFNAVGLLAVGLLLILVDLTNVWSGLNGLAPTGAGRWWHAVPLVVGCAAMLIKRAHPMLALGIGVVAFAGDVVIGSSLGMTLVLCDLLYASGLYASPTARRCVTGTVAVVVVVAAVASGEAMRDVRSFVSMALQIGALFGIPLWWAANVRQKTELAELAAQRAELEGQRAADLERIAELGQHEAVQAERAAMARDLHDVIASHLSAIAIHSGAALAGPPDPAKDRAALELVRSSSLTSLDEMRAMILLLRSDLPRADALFDAGSARPEPVAAPARLARLDDLVATARTSGLTVDVLDDSARQHELPAAVDQAAHRIVQEALTNAAKHSPGAHVSVRLAVVGSGSVDGTPGADDPEAHIEVTVENPVAETSAGQTSLLPALSAGTGLLTMRERAEALGGTFSAGRIDRGTAATWRVHAVLPTRLRAPERAGA